MYSLVVFNELKLLFKVKNCVIIRNSYESKNKGFLVDVNSLCCDSLPHLGIIDLDKFSIIAFSFE